jgi:hypothetical protein
MEHHHRNGGPPPNEATVNALERMIPSVVADRADQAELLRILSLAEPRSAIGILDATLFTFDPPTAPSGHPDAGVEDEWPEALHALTEKLGEIVEERELFLVLDTGKAGPRREVAEMLVSGRDCALFGAQPLQLEDRLNEALPGWRKMAARGKVAPVLRAIDGLAISPRDQKILHILALGAAGLGDPALVEIRSLDPADTLEPQAAAELSLIAAHGGGNDTAVSMLRRYQASFHTRHELETALRAAQRAVDDALIYAFVTSLQAIDPQSDLVQQHLYTEALRRLDHRAAQDLLAADPEKQDKADAHLYLADNLGSGRAGLRRHNRWCAAGVA